MSTTPPISEYMLLFHDNSWSKGLSPDQIQKVLGQFMAWFENLKETGKVKAGQPLEPEGKIISGRSGAGAHVSDGPFAESKEAIGGYFLLTVDSMEEAVAIARECPILNYGSTVEVRPVAERCPVARQLEMVELAAV